jgi:hypothetical protein
MILLLLGLQDPPQKAEDPKPAVVRKVRAKQEDVYEVALTTIGKAIVRYAYDMRLTVTDTKPDGDKWPMVATLENVKTEIAGKELDRGKFGSIKLEMPEAGFPIGLTFLGDTLPFSLPLLSFYLPESNESPLAFKSPMYDRVIYAAGTVTTKPGAEHQVQTSARFFVENEEKDQSMFRKLSMTAVFDTKTGQLIRSNGKYTAPDGTVNFRIKRAQ